MTVNVKTLKPSLTRAGECENNSWTKPEAHDVLNTTV